MQLNPPGPSFYSAMLTGYDPVPGTTKVIGHFQVYDGAQNGHNGLALDGVTAQQYLDIEIDLNSPPPDIQSTVRAGLQAVFVAECGGFANAIAQFMSDGPRFT